MNLPGRIELINRDISWLSFNERVLQEAEDTSVPLIQRLRFLGIFSNNLDEFFRVRVATIKRLINVDKKAKDEMGFKLRELQDEIQEKVMRQQKKFEITYQSILKELEKENIFIINEAKLNEEQAAFVKDHFHHNVRPNLGPIMLYKEEEFPYLKEKSIYLAIKFSNSNTKRKTPYALIEILTDVISRFIILPQRNDKKYIIILDDLIRFCLPETFSIFNYESIEAYTIKITRDAELDIDNDVSKSFLEKISRSVKQRKKASPVRFVYDAAMPEDLLSFITRSIHLNVHDNLISGGRYHNFKDFMRFPNVGGKELEYAPMPPLPHPLLPPSKNIMSVIQKQDLLLHYPYQSFGYMIDLLREAAIDPQVTAIKITIYRLAKKSNIINALINAAKNGKSVTVVIELQARFDEEANIHWSNRLQEEGVNVIFGVPGLKVHCKMCLITRRENGKTVHYANIGTGNYNEFTSLLYSDHSLFTADKRLSSEISKVFSFLEKNYKTQTYRHLIVSPTQMRKKMVRLINKEITNAKVGKPAYIILKLNNLVDYNIIRRLYQASAAGVKIKLIIRGICSLVPGIKAMSENIEAISIVDKFLEHSRIFVFCNNGDGLYFLSSADLMTRNIDYRVEITTPVYDNRIKKELTDFLNLQFGDNIKARIIDELQNNSYVTAGAAKKVRSQFVFYDYLKTLLK